MLYHVKTHAIKFCLSSGIQALPVDVMTLKCPGLSWQIFTYDHPAAKMCIDQFCLQTEREKYPALAVALPDGTYLVLYDSKLSQDERQLYIAHEIGHIYLRHSVTNYVVGKDVDSDLQSNQDVEADNFAYYILAPSCILRSAEIKSAKAIQQAAAVSFETATVAWKMIEDEQYTPDEKRLNEQCHEFITQWKRGGVSGTLHKKAVIASLAVIVVSLAVTFALLHFAPKDNSTASLPSQEINTLGTDAKAKVENPQPLMDEQPNNNDTAPTETQTFYKTTTGTKFHAEDCHHLKSKFEVTYEDAVENGLEPCNTCEPLED